ncbi:MAG: hypothetical protein KDN19_05955 [Verrucomicrobiae bacterium]|nr:hypothetical protein [Verrucomicrobiae bacterium]
MNQPTTKLAITTAAIALAVVGFASPNSARAEYGNDLISLSHRLEGLAEELTEEFSEHYRHTEAYRHLISDAAQIEDEAEHIHRLAHDPYASLGHIATDLEELDELAHHLHELVDQTERGRYGHVHGDTRHVHEMLAFLNRVIHAMEDEVDDLRHHDFHHDRGHEHRDSIYRERGGFRLSIRR